MEGFGLPFFMGNCESMIFSNRTMWKMLYVCDPPCLSMRNNAPVKQCAAEDFILQREIVLTMKTSFTLRAYLMIKITSIAR